MAVKNKQERIRVGDTTTEKQISKVEYVHHRIGHEGPQGE